MKTSLAWHNLLHKKVKTGVAIAGVAFAIVLMFMQLGFLEAVKGTATLIYNALDFDICIRSRDYLHLAAARTFPRTRLIQAGGVAGVRQVAPFTVANNAWRNRFSGERRAILCFAVAPEDPVFLNPDTQASVREQLRRSDDLLIDTKTRRDYGPQDGVRFGPEDQGAKVELSGHWMRIAGYYTCGAGLSSNGTAILTDAAMRRTARNLPDGHISLGLIKIASSTDLRPTVIRLQESLDRDVEVKTRQEVLDGELNHWVYETNYGLIFQTGVLLAVVVGVAIVYQVLASDVASMLPEYATLKAIGYSNHHLATIVLQQSIVLAVSGFLVGWPLSQLLYAITAAGAQIPMDMTWRNAVMVFGLTILMCIGSGVAALRKAFQADPADLF